MQLVSDMLSFQSSPFHFTRTNQCINQTVEPPRWRFAAFAALMDKNTVAYKMTTVTLESTERVTTSGIYTGYWVGGKYNPHAIIESGDSCLDIDSMAKVEDSGGTTEGLLVESVAIERDGFRGNYLCISVACGTVGTEEEGGDEEEEEADWAGIYCANIVYEPVPV